MEQHREAETYLGCQRDPSSQAPGRRAGRQPCPAVTLQHLLQHYHGARHRHSALSRALRAKHSSFPRHFPSQGFSNPCNYTAKIKGISHTSESPQPRVGFTRPTPTCSLLTPGRFPFLALTPGHPGLWTAAGCLDLLQTDVLWQHPIWQWPRSAPERL